MTDTADNHAQSDAYQEDKPLIEEILRLIAAMQKRAEAEEDEEREWMLRNCSNPAVAEHLRDMTIMELHVLDAIGQLGPVNGITISKQFGIFKGTVSKITRRLAAKNLIQKEFLPDNKKEILFRTTPLGSELYQLHQALHRQLEIGVVRFLQKYETDELRLLVRVLQDASKASWVHPESSPDTPAEQPESR
ncbi:MarR family transcriptional regulator [Paenibacillus melissococcoides]|uniref:MarR family transcriptional regulator n=1 Tax=Paenibacillus melissococcoides TaxID=2912268 RepID=A0ABM9G4A3_9BACL|nr:MULTISPECIES: MarR family transcriptional regulator [Paenibacillus]MEB9897968.1 MarR family transcriptional regulator [Bacillus cereus]CAH8246565.1 MarR family transcriptional regulator [Paenibacillus melissococcoides]CAH8715124.1 MarR family transcriptional regulator [Paenibacillus melissococcoides]CAH8716057.1 MarR family transcriptional regulator [Paenibacillus melissococcoides]GIO82837.1 hypothetical protein J6TS7_64470 [Paenibacillus dendritiformis]